MESATINRAMYLAWLRQNFPLLYYKAAAPVILRAKEVGLNGFFDTIVGGFKSVVSTVTKSLPDLAKTYTEYDLQRRIIKENTTRATQGLPPLQVGLDGQLMQQPVSFSNQDLMLAQQMQQFQAQSIADDRTTLLLFGGAALVVILIATRRK